MVFPAISLASAGAVDGTIKSVYFQDENGNMVFVDYGEAIRQSLKEDHTLYNAIREYVGAAEAKGKPIYLELLNGKILDYRLAMLDNLFRLSEIIGKEKYEVSGEIKATHELKIVDGKAVIVEKEDPEEVELVRIIPVDGIEVEAGTTEERVKELLPQTTTIIDSKDRRHTVNLDWTIEDYNGEIEGKYTAIGRFELPEGIKNSANLELEVVTKVKVKAPVVQPDFPEEVEDVFVGKSQITKNTYANIKIKKEYLSVVDAVYVDEKLANNMEDEPSQWRIEVADGTTVDDLKERITLTVTTIMIKEIEPVENISVKFGTPKNEAIKLLSQETTIKDNRGRTHNVDLNWTIENYNGNLPGDYDAVATFTLPNGVNENPNIELEVKATITVLEEVILTKFTEDSLLGKGFSLGKLIVYKAAAEGYENAAQYAVRYTVGSSNITVVTDRADLGEAPIDLVQYINDKNRVDVILYDAEGNEIATIENILNK